MLNRLPRTLAPLLALAALLAPAPSHAQQPEADLNTWVGGRVVVKEGTILSLDNGKPDESRVTYGIYSVKRADGDRLWIEDEGSDSKGWTAPDRLIPLEHAADFFTVVIRDDPSDASRYVFRGLVWNAREEYDKAIADYDQAIRLAPKDASIYPLRAIAWSAKGEHDKAIADCTEAIRLDPTDASLYVDRGLARNAKGDQDGAQTDYDEAIRLDPTDSSVYILRGLGWSARKDHDKALSDYHEAIRLDPGAAYTYILRGLAHAAKEDFERAITDYGEAIRLDPTNALAHLNRGVARAAKEDFDGAIADYGEAIRLEPANASAHALRSNARREKQDYQGALADYGEAIRLDPTDASSYNGRAFLWASAADEKARDGRRAVESSLRACELNEWSLAADLETLAAAYAESGDFAAAVKWQEKAIDLLDEDDAKALAESRSRLDLYREGKPFHLDAIP